MRRSPFYRRFGIQWTWPRWPVLREILQLGMPMSLSYTLEATEEVPGGGLGPDTEHHGGAILSERGPRSVAAIGFSA